jgi:hypothetical protein
MKILYIVMLSLLFFTSCITQNRIDRKCRKAKLKYEIEAAKWGCPKDLDSTFVQSQVIIKDTTIYVPVPGETVHDSIPVIITKGLMNSPVSLLETTYSRTIQTIKVPYYVDRPISKPLHWWQKLFIWSGVIAWWFVGLYILKKFYKFKIG